eukprot:12000863-Prorocentrum_lima.AAC.1
MPPPIAGKFLKRVARWHQLCRWRQKFWRASNDLTFFRNKHAKALKRVAELERQLSTQRKQPETRTPRKNS